MENREKFHKLGRSGRYELMQKVNKVQVQCNLFSSILLPKIEPLTTLNNTYKCKGAHISVIILVRSFSNFQQKITTCVS